MSDKKQTAFRISEGLLIRLKAEAEKQNRSLNNYVEFVLSKIIENKPNNTTHRAIEEARNDINLETIDDVNKFLSSI